MRIDNGKYKFEKRRKRFFTPIIYMLAEITLIWILLSVVNLSFEIMRWEIWSYILWGFTTLYSAYKTYFIFDRQKEYQPA